MSDTRQTAPRRLLSRQHRNRVTDDAGSTHALVSIVTLTTASPAAGPVSKCAENDCSYGLVGSEAPGSAVRATGMAGPPARATVMLRLAASIGAITSGRICTVARAVVPVR
ncbi:hypothetical protein D1F64_15595 [Breoghania sp. L-A4]|nr:hypothetical protein D1F64_15595 [Breoghania sp. L-A4]